MTQGFDINSNDYAMLIRQIEECKNIIDSNSELISEQAEIIRKRDDELSALKKVIDSAALLESEKEINHRRVLSERNTTIYRHREEIRKIKRSRAYKLSCQIRQFVRLLPKSKKKVSHKQISSKGIFAVPSGDSKTLLIAHLHLSTGGIEISLLNLLKEISNLNIEVVLLLWNKTADTQIVNIIEAEKYCRVFQVPDVRRLSVEERDALSYCLKFGVRNKNYKLLSGAVKRISRKLFGEYQFDYGIDFFGADFLNGLIVRESAHKAFIWQHTDIFMNFSHYYEANPGQTYLPTFYALRSYYSLFDRVVSVSKKIGEINERKLEYPSELKTKMAYVTNFIDGEKILEQANKPLLPDDEILFHELRQTSCKVFCYIGRLSFEKNLENLIKGFIMYTNTLQVEMPHLIIVGDGVLMDELAGIADGHANILFLGSRQNPYNILRLSDIFVLPSNFEAFPLTLHEARVLQKQILMCDFETAESLAMENAQLIVGHSPDEIAGGLRAFCSGEVNPKYSWDAEDHNKKSLKEFKRLL